MNRRRAIAAGAALAFFVFAACQAKIGDKCDDNVDCSPDGDRICDLSQPGGYCTIPDCEPDSCPDEAVCVRFWDGPHSRSWCMKKCKSDGGCRSKYYCAAGYSEVAEIIDDKAGNYGFCIERPQEPYDAGEEDDAAAEDVSEDDAAGIPDDAGDPDDGTEGEDAADEGESG